MAIMKGTWSTRATVGFTAVVAFVAVLLIAGTFGRSAGAHTGQYLYFTGPDTGYIEVPHDPALSPSEAITIEAWVFLEDLDSRPLSGEPSLIGKDYADSYLLTVWNGVLRFYSGTSADSVTSNAAVSTDQWVHVAVAYDESTARFYVNGVLVDTQAFTSPLASSASNLRIGSDEQWAYSPQGALDEVRLWNVARSGADIAADVNTTIMTGRPGLVGVWNMEGSPNADVGGFAGTLVGDAEFRSEPLGPVPKQGDVDCSGSVNAVDSLKVLRYVAGLSVAQTEPCPDIGTEAPIWGDVDCSGAVNSVDALKLLRYVAGLSVAQTEPCTDIGEPLQ